MLRVLAILTACLGLGLVDLSLLLCIAAGGNSIFTADQTSCVIFVIFYNRCPNAITLPITLAMNMMTPPPPAAIA